MAINLARFALAGVEKWGVAFGDRISPLDGSYPSTAALIALGEADWRAAAQRSPSVQLRDVVLLSPGCTSYDAFKDFEERGQAFRKWVNEL